ncbi:MAG: PIN domain-containing protein [Acidobacteria bacterium]|nr:PIN domain-containing protein [Acidobacteriota bacterium]
MESALLGVVLDSSVAIEAELRRLNATELLRQLAARFGDCEIALSAISVAELAHGIHRATTPERYRTRREFLDDLKAAVPVYPIRAETAELAGKIGAESARRGIVIPFDDLLIGVIALERGYAVATCNTRHFEKIPGLVVVSWPAPQPLPPVRSTTL